MHGNMNVKFRKQATNEILDGGGKFMMRLIFDNFYLTKKQNSVTEFHSFLLCVLELL